MQQRPILGSPNYIATDTGEIYSQRGRLATRPDKSGYPKVDLGRRKTRNVHRLIWEAFNGPIPDRLEVNHRNGDKNDNRLENLELVTRSENMTHAYATGLMRKRKIAVPHGADAFTRFLCEKGPAEIADTTGVSRALVYAWIHGRSNPKKQDREAVEAMMSDRVVTDSLGAF